MALRRHGPRCEVRDCRRAGTRSVASVRMCAHHVMEFVAGLRKSDAGQAPATPVPPEVRTRLIQEGWVGGAPDTAPPDPRRLVRFKLLAARS